MPIDRKITRNYLPQHFPRWRQPVAEANHLKFMQKLVEHEQRSDAISNRNDRTTSVLISFGIRFALIVVVTVFDKKRCRKKFFG